MLYQGNIYKFSKKQDYSNEESRVFLKENRTNFQITHIPIHAKIEKISMMTSKKRVHAALSRKPVDRVPVFMWFHPVTVQKLARRLEIPVTYLDEVMGNDVKQTWVNNNYAMEGIVHDHEGETHTDFWGITWIKEGPFNQIQNSPLAGKDKEAIRAYQFPTARLDELLKLMSPVLEFRDNYFIGCDISPCLFEMYSRLRGMEDALIDIAADPEMAMSMLQRCADFAILLGEAACERFPLDWYWTGDDVASQQALLIHPDTWRKMIKPELKRIIDVGKRHRLWIAYHCCGALRSIIPDLIEIGVDVLNPVQCDCPGMDPISLKQEFGKELAFMGGVDTNYLLPNGSPDEVRSATFRLIEAMTRDGGGYILAASHTIPPETPDENIFAMYDVAGQSREEIFDRAANIRSHISKNS
jgi:uroporphyrinogen decarboxylase